jgi:hypothetical protein
MQPRSHNKSRGKDLSRRFDPSRFTAKTKLTLTLSWRDPGLCFRLIGLPRLSPCYASALDGPDSTQVRTRHAYNERTRHPRTAARRSLLPLPHEPHCDPLALVFRTPNNRKPMLTAALSLPAAPQRCVSRHNRN